MEASLEANQSFSGTTELPPKKRSLDRGKVVLENPPPPQTNALLIPDLNSSEQPSFHENGSQDKGKKALVDQEPPHEPSFNIFLNPKKSRRGESSKIRCPIVCKFCGQQFATTQALGGHQNAHKQEREMQKTMKAAYELGRMPFLGYNLQVTRATPFQGSYGQQIQNPYLGYAHRGSQLRGPVQPQINPGLGMGSPGLVRTLERFTGSSEMKPVGPTYDPQWIRAYISNLGQMRGSKGPANFSSLATSNSTAFLQAVQNEASPAKKPRMEATPLILSPKGSESAKKLDVPIKNNESAKLDLTLKL